MSVCFETFVAFFQTVFPQNSKETSGAPVKNVKDLGRVKKEPPIKKKYTFACLENLIRKHVSDKTVEGEKQVFHPGSHGPSQRP